MRARSSTRHTLAQLTLWIFVLQGGCYGVKRPGDAGTVSETDATDLVEQDAGDSDGGIGRRSEQTDASDVMGSCSGENGAKCTPLCDPFNPSGPCGNSFPDPYPYACGDGTPECMQLCDALCAVGPACGREAEACLTECREELRCPGETPGMDIVICDGYASTIEAPQDTCHVLDLILRDTPPDPDPLCALVTHGASFEGPVENCPLPAIEGDCMERLRVDAQSFAWSFSLTLIEGSHQCDADGLVLQSALEMRTWTYDVATWTLRSTDGVSELQLVQPSFEPTPAE